MAVEVGVWPRIEGLCGNKNDHEPHNYVSTSLGEFWCHADQTRRLPYAAELRRIYKKIVDEQTNG